MCWFFDKFIYKVDVLRNTKLADFTRDALGCLSVEICAVPQDRIQGGVAFAKEAAKEVLWGDRWGGAVASMRFHKRPRFFFSSNSSSSPLTPSSIVKNILNNEHRKCLYLSAII